MAKEIEFTIDENGNVEIDMINFQGKGCADLSGKLAKALGEQVEHVKKKEYYKPKQTQKQKVIRGF